MLLSRSKYPITVTLYLPLFITSAIALNVFFFHIDDKNFLETEKRGLERAPLSLSLPQSSDDRNQKPVETYKRRRRMTRSPIEYNAIANASISRLPSPAWSNNTNESVNSNVEKQISGTIPPMTFDQGTQTDFKVSADGGMTQSKEISKISQKLEMLMIENQQLRKENQSTKQMLTDLANHTHDVKTMMKDIHKKLEFTDRDPHIINSQMKANNEPIVLFTKSSNQIVNLSHTEIDNNVAIETYDVNNESSNISYSNCSRMSSAVSNSSIYNSTMMASHQSPSTSESINHMQNSMVNDIKHNWNVIEIDDLTEEVIIGSNGTKVHKTVLESIKWTSHSNATRKLLSALFSREMLATHSLTGKPSPGTTPVKFKLTFHEIQMFIPFSVHGFGETNKKSTEFINHCRYCPVCFTKMWRNGYSW